MSSQLYLCYRTRQMFKSQIELYVKIISERVFVVFDDIENDANELAEKYYAQIMSHSDYDCVDPADVAQHSIDAGDEYYDNLSLMQYNTILNYTAMMYQYWEQQVRKFLYDEISHTYELDSKNFCFNIKGIKKEFASHGVNLEELGCWGGIDELRLLCNVIKHGEGDSEEQLRQSNPKIFKTYEQFDLMEFHRTSLLKNVLNLDGNDLVKYSEYLIRFWDELPERMFEINHQEN